VRFFAIFGDHQCRSSCPFHDARGNDPDYATVPIIPVKDQAELAAKIGFGCELSFYFRHDSRFFALPLDERLKVKLTIGKNRGYQPLGSRMYGDKADAPDLNESYKYQHDLPPDDPDIRAGDRVHALNLWPENLPGWREALTFYYDEIERLSEAVLRAFALALDLEEDWFLGFYRKPLTQINLLHYPPHPPVTPGRQFGLRPHADTTAFTVLAQGDVEGLQVEDKEGWIDVPPIPGTYVINIGDMMARWTNDRFASTPHRVINRSGRERYSVPFFAIPDFDALVECLPSCRGPANPPKYPPLKVGDFMNVSNTTDWNKDAAVKLD